VFALSDGVVDTSVPTLDGSPSAIYRVARTGDELRVSAVHGTDELELLTLRLDAVPADTAHEVPDGDLQVRLFATTAVV
jgi:hypothetical protein